MVKSRVNWAGHLLRMKDERLPNSKKIRDKETGKLQKQEIPQSFKMERLPEQRPKKAGEKDNLRPNHDQGEIEKQ